MQVTGSGSRGTIYGIPTQENSYTQSLYEAVRQRGVEVKEGIWAGRWLFSNLASGDTLHLHWPSFQYYDSRSYSGSLISLLRFVIICLMLRMRGVRIVWTAHNLYPHDGGRDLWIHRFARWFVVRIADRIFTHGRTAAAIVRDEFKLSNSELRIIYHGHWIDAYPNDTTQSEARERLGLSSTDHIFLFIGLCKPYKGLENLIDSIAALPAGASLLIAGEFQSPEYEAEISELAKRAGPSRVSIHPAFIDDHELQLYLNAADTVVLPYREILTSGTAVLAMSFGRPVVVPNLGSLVDIVDESCGVLYDANQPTALGQAMQQARTTNFNADEIRKHIATYTWDDAARALIDEHLGYDATNRGSYLKTTFAAFTGAVLLVVLQFMFLPNELHSTLAMGATAVLWLIVFACVVAFASGVIVLIRDSRERKHKADLFYKYVSRRHASWTSGWRRYIRPLLGPTIRPGDTVRVRSAAEILATLDESGKLDGLPFMPEMIAYQGGEFLVHRRIDKINDWINHNEKRRTKNIVTLVDVRCNGADHGGCQAACQILWNDRWLERLTGNNNRISQAYSSQSKLHDLERVSTSAVTRQASHTEETIKQYMCQITELLHISTPLKPFDLRQDLRPLLNGNISLAGWLIAILTITFNGLQSLRRGVDYPVTGPQLEQGPTPIVQLNLQPGELVKVRNKYEIGMTLHKNHNRGIWFGGELVRFCNQQYTVHSRVEKIINERSGEMMTLKTPSVILDSVCGSGEFLRFCPQNEYAFWREIWLERVEPL